LDDWRVVLSTFVLIQLGICVLGVGIVYFMHGRRLHNEGMLAFHAWEQVSSALADNEGEEAHKNWLAERASAISGDEPVNAVRKLVLEQEQKDAKTLAKLLQPFLLPPGMREEWGRLRAEQVARITELAANTPSAARCAMTEFEHFASVDAQLDYKPEKLPAMPEGGGDSESASLAEENAALKAELASMLAGTDDDLRKMLKQFTQDSREMMGCIQQLEKENQALKASLDKAQAA
jgi:hypothetical protein